MLCGRSIMPPATDTARRRSITTVKPGATFDYVATAANGWHAIVVGKQVGWVSGKYSKIV